MPGRRATLGALLLAAASTAGFIYLVTQIEQPVSYSLEGRTLLAGTVEEPTKWKWNRLNIAGIVLSVLVSLTSTIDRESGSSMYIVIFAVLLGLDFREAIAMTTFTVALGSLGPAIAAMSEPRVTERGILALVDYPGCMLLLPTMYYGISWGVIINMSFPNWLLCLLLVLVMAASNSELLYTMIALLKLRTQAFNLATRLRDLGPHQVGPPPPAAAAAAGGPAAAGTTTTHQQHQQQGASVGDVVVPVEDQEEVRAAIRAEAEFIARRAGRLEGLALLYPAYYTPTVDEAMGRFGVDLPGGPLKDPAPPQREPACPMVEAIQRAESSDLDGALRKQRSWGTQYTWGWRAWWRLQPHFEIGMVLKIVIWHLLTEFIRSYTTKPCSVKFWFMIGPVTTAVTCMLIFVVTTYSRRRLWRGPHWVEALHTVMTAKAAAGTKDQAAAAGAGGSGAEVTPPSDIVAVAGPSAAAAPPAAHGSTAAPAPTSSSCGQCGNHGPKEPGSGCCCCGCCPPRIKGRLPCVWGPPAGAITHIGACNSHNQYSSWSRQRMVSCAVVLQLVGSFGCALGVPSGPAMGYMLSTLGLKPHVVAGSSRFLVLCFCLGSSVAYAIAGNTRGTKFAVAYALLNLGLAPLGMVATRHLRPPIYLVLTLSLVMGLLGMVLVIIWQLVPLMAYLVGAAGELPFRHLYLASSVAGNQNHFDLQRFCLHGHSETH